MNTHAARGQICVEQPPIRLKHCRHGLFMYNLHDKYVGRSLDIYGEFSESEWVLMRRFIKPGMTVIDIGANIGAHTVSLAQQIGATGQVIAFEPQRVIYHMLCGNVALNSLLNVSPLMAALGNQAGSITVPPLDYTQPNNFGGVSLGAHTAGEVVPLMTLDSFNLPSCDFIKIDVEGMEQSVLAGARGLLTRCRPILYVENDRPEKSQALLTYLLDLDYRLYWHLPPLFNSENFFSVQEDIFSGLCSTNVLALPQEKNMATAGLKEITRANVEHYIHGSPP